MRAASVLENCRSQKITHKAKTISRSQAARARDSDFNRFFADLLGALGFATNATLPAWWQGGPARAHVRRWIDDLGLTEGRIIEIATETRCDHPNPPDGPKALDRFAHAAVARICATGYPHVQHFPFVGL